MMRTAYFLLDARVRALRSDLIRDWRHLPADGANEYRVDHLLAAVAFVAEERGMQECVSQRARETTLRLIDLTAENDALRADAERLDWLESKGCLDINLWRKGHSAPAWSVYLPEEAREAFGAPTLRAALDAARHPTGGTNNAQ
jgi:hypothetical protein